MATPQQDNIKPRDNAVRASEAQDKAKQKDRKSQTVIRTILLKIWCRFSTILTLRCGQAC
jgi:hypothetical protein